MSAQGWACLPATSAQQAGARAQQGPQRTPGAGLLTAVELVAVVGAVGPAVAAQLLPDAAPRVTHELPRARCRGGAGLESRRRLCPGSWLPALPPPQSQPPRHTEDEDGTRWPALRREELGCSWLPGEGLPARCARHRFLELLQEGWPGSLLTALTKPRKLRAK